MSDAGLARIRNHVLDERRRSIAYVAGLGVAGAIAVAALVIAILTIAGLGG